MDDSTSSGGFSGGGLPPRPTMSTTRRRAQFIAPHSRPATSSVDANLPRRQELASPGNNGSGNRMSSPGGGRNGCRMPSRSSGVGCGLPRRLPNAQPTLGPRALSFTEPHAATWDAGRITTSPAEVYQIADDDFSPNHWTPDYSQPRASSAPGSGYFTNILTHEVDDDLELLRQQEVQEDATPSTGSKSKRGNNYTNLEDIQLCNSWIHISNDPIIGNQQSGKTYWERIANDFHMNRDFESDRTPNSLEPRFGIILKECMKFQGYYEEVQRRHPSGIPYQEHLLEAHARYARKANGKNCQFEQCWLTLRYTQKFESTLEANKKPTKSRELNLSVGSEQENDESTTQGQESSSIPSAKKARPPGRKQSKEKLKKNEGDDEYKDMMQNLLVMKTKEHMMKKERWEKDMMLEQRKLKMEEERLQWEQEQKIMFCDVTTMDNDQRAYVKAKRAKIVKAMSASVGETASDESAV